MFRDTLTQPGQGLTLIFSTRLFNFLFDERRRGSKLFFFCRGCACDLGSGSAILRA